MRGSPVVAGVGRLLERGLDTPTIVGWIDAAVALGVTTFDVGGCSTGEDSMQARFGDALAAAQGLRDRLQIVVSFGVRDGDAALAAHGSKCYDSSTPHLRERVDAALVALRTDRIDLLLLQRPDLLVEPAALADALRGLIAAGKVQHFGVAHHSPAQVDRLRRHHPIAAHRFEFSPLQMKALADGTLEQCADLRLPALACSPLAGGRVVAGTDAQAERVRAVLADLGAHHDASPATVAHAWLMRHPARPRPVVATQRVDALRDAMAAVALAPRLGRDDWYRVWQASLGHALP